MKIWSTPSSAASSAVWPAESFMATQKSVGECLRPSREISSFEAGVSTGRKPREEKKAEDQTALPPMVEVALRMPTLGLPSRSTAPRDPRGSPWKCFSTSEWKRAT